MLMRLKSVSSAFYLLLSSLCKKHVLSLKIEIFRRKKEYVNINPPFFQTERSKVHKSQNKQEQNAYLKNLKILIYLFFRGEKAKI
jgi:hypothetical protein